MSHGLIKILDEQISAAESMLGALDRENQALVDGDSDELNEAGADKARLVETLESLERERRDFGALDELSRSAARDDSASERWQKLLTVIEECGRRNRQNGSLVKARHNQILGALNILRGSGPQLYDASGLKPSSNDAHPLGSA